MTYIIAFNVYVTITLAATLASLPATTAAAIKQAASSLYMWLLATLFGDCQPATVVAAASIEPTDILFDEYQDGVYEIFKAGHRHITYLNRYQVANLLAFGHTLATIETNYPLYTES